MSITYLPMATANKNQPSLLKATILLVLMLLAAGAAVFLRPTQKISAQHPQFNLEAMIPKQFGVWRLDDRFTLIQVTHDRQAVLNQIYNQTVSRTYFDDQGNRIMLSIAYGGDQGDTMRVHKPEVCYFDQGYQVQNVTTNKLNTDYGSIVIKRMLTTNGLRVEPVTYWIKIGDTITVHDLKWKLSQIRYGLMGQIPDGLIFRVSSISDESIGYILQEKFIRDLLAAISSEDRAHLIGKDLQ
jgi:EpsI family protein